MRTKYYSLKNILSKNATYNIIMGERSNGKTYAVLKYAIEQYFKKGSQLAIIRRWKEDISGRRAREIFSALIENDEVYKISGGEYQSIYYLAGVFYFCNYDEKNKVIYNPETDKFAFCFALSETEHNKSISYPNVNTILFDEFLTRHVYLTDEFVLFMNTLSTIIRQRDGVKIFMLGNTVNKFSPYFTEMGLTNAKNMEQGTIDVYHYGNSDLTVAFEYCGTLNRRKQSDKYFAFNNPKLQMITGGKWELDIYPHLPMKYKPKNILFTYFIEFDGSIFQCEIVKVNNIYFTYIHEKTTPIKDTEGDLIYSFDNKAGLNYNTNIYKPFSEIQKKVLWFFNHNKVYYQNNDVGDSINNYLKLCYRG